MDKRFNRVAVIGAGSWGTALANVLAGNGVETMLWTRSESHAAAMQQTRMNAAYLPEIALADRLTVTCRLTDCAAMDAILLAVPAQTVRAVARDVRAAQHDPHAAIPVAIAAKGIERETLHLMPAVLQAVWPEALPAMVSGPSFAGDVARGLPTAVTFADANGQSQARWLASLGTRTLRLYPSRDLIGVALGGAVKNVLAIATGIVDGRGLGESARAALIARGFAEFQRLALAMGAKAETLSGLSGLGDLVLTASSARSRNMALGQSLGRGDSLDDLLARPRVTSEGEKSASAVVGLAQRHEVEMPICNAVARIIEEGVPIDRIIQELLLRPVSGEG